MARLSGREALIVEALRTPMGKAHPDRGWYRDTHPNELLGAVYDALLASTGLSPSAVEDLVIGCTAPFGEQSRNIARNAWLQAGYPAEVPATVLDRRCGSAQTAVEMADKLRQMRQDGQSGGFCQLHLYHCPSSGYHPTSGFHRFSIRWRQSREKP